MNETIDEKYIQCQMKCMMHCRKEKLYLMSVFPFTDIVGRFIILIGNKFYEWSTDLVSDDYL